MTRVELQWNHKQFVSLLFLYLSSHKEIQLLVATRSTLLFISFYEIFSDLKEPI